MCRFLQAVVWWCTNVIWRGLLFANAAIDPYPAFPQPLSYFFPVLGLTGVFFLG